MPSILPLCRHRGDELRTDEWLCASPKVVALAGTVRAADCRACHCIDHPPVADDFPLLIHADLLGSAGDGAAAAGPAVYEVELRPASLAIVMIAAPRSAATVDRSLASLRRGGFTQPIDVFAEPGTAVAPASGVTIHESSTRLGAWRNWRQSARWLLENSTSPFLLVCEDDIELAEDAALGLQHAIDTLPRDGWGFASLYTPRWNLRNHSPVDGWQAVDLREGGCGSLAYCFTRESLEGLLRRTEPQANAHGDADFMAILTFTALNRHCYFHVPSLCDHTGHGISTLGHSHSDDTAAVGFQAASGLYRPKAAAPRPPSPVCGPVAVSRPPAPASADFSDTTVCVTVLFRFHLVERFLNSVRRHYPEIAIVVADNSFHPEDWGGDEFLRFREIVCRHAARPVLLPFNSGVSATRNAAVAAAETPYVIVCEEDFQFTARTNLERLLRPVRAGLADIVGGLEHYTNPANGWLRACVPAERPPTVQYAADVEFIGAAPLRRLQFSPVDHESRSELAGVVCRRADVIHNFYAASRAAYLKSPCDAAIKVSEHLDHFLRLKRDGARVYYTPEAVVEHHSPDDSADPRFLAARRTAENYHRRFCENWQVDPRPTTDYGSFIPLTSVEYLDRGAPPRKSTARVFLATVVYDDTQLVPHFLRHYAALGVDTILIAAHDSVYKAVAATAQGFPAFVDRVECAHFDCAQKLSFEKELLARHGAGPGDFVIYCDIDEFHEYPAPLAEIMRRMAENDIAAVRGQFVDRLARDGRLASIQSTTDLFSQFPIACRVSRDILQAFDEKIMLCRGWVSINSGHHKSLNASCGPAPVPGNYFVHHFKWTAGLIARLRKRLAQGNVGEDYIRECNALFEICGDDRGFDLGDVQLEVVGNPGRATARLTAPCIHHFSVNSLPTR